MSVTIQHLNKNYQTFVALRDINLQLKSGELTALLGPSGCGKTTLLRTLAGLETCDNGTILFDNRDITHLAPAKREVGFVFQHFALFQHMTIFENVAFGLKALPRKQRPSSTQIARQVQQLLELVKLPHLANAYPAQLSGGQRQRIALARALAVKPKILLLDEPFSALDAQVRKTMRRWLRSLQQELNITTIFVTHDQDEALEISDRIVVMNQGQVEQVDIPQNIYYSPQTEFVTEFLGDTNVFHGEVTDNQLVIGEFKHVLPQNRYQRNTVQVKTDQQAHHNSAKAYIRPYELTLSHSAENALAKGVITHTHTIGFLVRVELESKQSQQPIEVMMTKERYQQQQFQRGETVYLIPDNMNLFQNMNM